MTVIPRAPIAVAAASILLVSAFNAALAAQSAHMEILQGKDLKGEVFKRLGLPNQDYCWEQCLNENRCEATRWGFIEGATAGQCQLLTGELIFSDPKQLTTGDGQKINVIVSRKVTRAAEI